MAAQLGSGWSQAIAPQSSWKPETENREASGAVPSRNPKRETETRISAGALQSHQIPAGNWKPQIEKRLEKVQTGV